MLLSNTLRLAVPPSECTVELGTDKQLVKGNLIAHCGEACDGLASHPRGVAIYSFLGL